jgi:hypothetical protein
MLSQAVLHEHESTEALAARVGLEVKKLNANLNLHRIKLLSHEAHTSPIVAQQAADITNLAQSLASARDRLKEAL